MDEEIPQNPINIILSEFGTRLNEIEEKQRLIKDRMLLIGDNLISLREDLERDSLEFKKQIKTLNFEVKTSKKLIERIINELTTLAKKTELEILQRQIKMFNPLKPVTIEEVKKIIKES